jgi:phosphoenolpyruvate carboxylase
MLTTDITYYKNQIKEFCSILGFFTDEIKVLQHRLGEVTTKNTGQQVLSQVEHFQNQFIIYQEQFQILLHDARRLEAVAVKISTHETVYVADFLIDHRRLAEKVNTAAEIFRDIKHSCYRFLSAVLLISTL